MEWLRRLGKPLEWLGRQGSTLDWLNTGLAVLSSPIPDQLQDAAQLHDFLDDLRTSMLGARAVMELADWWRFKPEYHMLNQFLRELHDAMCDAEDLIGELGYEELKLKVEETHPRGITAASGQMLQNFLKYFGDLLKRNAKRISDAQKKIGAKTKLVRDFLRDRNLGDRKKEEKPLMPITTSLHSEPHVFGREGQVEEIIDIVLAPFNARGEPELGLVTSDEPEPSTRKRKAVAGGARVLPIVGIGGVGKTTLAREVYNDPRVKERFDRRAWVCISDKFDMIALTRSIVTNLGEKVSREQTNDLNYLQTKLAEVVRTKRTLMIFDDLWNEDQFKWKDFYAPFFNAKEGSIIIVTTRLPSVIANMRTGNMLDTFDLKGLPDEDLWNLFKVCAFGSDNLNGYVVLENIGRQILPKLCGSPLAAQTVGRLLSTNRDVRHWQNVRDSELYQLKEGGERDILPSLRLSYQYLPSHLKRCFSFCATFEKDFLVSRDELIYSWIAHGLVECPSGKRVEDVANENFRNLTERYFLLKGFYGCYTMHDLMHDVAQSVSFDKRFEVKCSKDLSCLSPSVRHVRVDLDHFKENFILDFTNSKQLRSLCIVYSESKKIESLSINRLEGLTNLRQLYIMHSMRNYIGNFKLLQYLQFLGSNDDDDYENTELPESVWSLYNLKYFFLHLARITPDVTKLVNLRRLNAICEDCPDLRQKAPFPYIGRMSALHDLPEFTVREEEGYTIAELMHMNNLCGSLWIYNLQFVHNGEEARKAELDKKDLLDELGLCWVMDENLHPEHAAVLEGLCPHRNLEVLKIRNYSSDELSPSWLKPEWLCYLTELHFESCDHISKLPLLSKRFELLTTLGIIACHSLASLVDLSPNNLPGLKSLCTERCDSLVELPADGFEGFSLLEDLTIDGCGFSSLHFHNLQALKELHLCDLHALEELHLRNLRALRDLSFHNLQALKELRIEGLSIELPADGFEGLSLLEDLNIERCNEIGSLHFHNLQALKELRLLGLHALEELRLHNLPALKRLSIGHSASLSSIMGLEYLACLIRFSVEHTPALSYSIGASFPTSLKYIRLENSGNFACLLGRYTQNLPALIDLRLTDCKEITLLALGENMRPTQCLIVQRCQKLRWLGERSVLDPISNVVIEDNPMLFGIGQPLEIGDPQMRNIYY